MRLRSVGLTHTNRLHAAEHEARRALQLEPELPDGHLALGLALRGRGKLGDARKALEQVLALEPEHVGAMLGLAQLRRQHGDRRGERELLERALQVAPADASVHVYSVWTATLGAVWLAVAVYSWVGPGLFRAALEKELEQVRLRDDF